MSCILMRLQADTECVDQFAGAITCAAFMAEPEPQADGGLRAKLQLGDPDIPACKVDGAVDLVGWSYHLCF